MILDSARSFLNSLWGRLLISHVVIALASLSIAGLAVISGIVPIYNALTYTRMEDSLILAYAAAQDMPRGLGPPAGSPQDPDTIPQQLLTQRFNTIFQRQLDAQKLRMLVVDLETDTVSFDSAGNWTGQPARFQIQTQSPRANDLGPPVVRAGRTNILRSRARVDGRTWLYVSVRLDPADRMGSMDRPDRTAPVGASAIVLLTPSTSLGDARQYIQAVLPRPLLLVILSGLFVTIWLLSAGFTRSLTRNLRPVITGTQEIAAGNLDYRVSDSASSLAEVKSLGDSFNRMAEEVQASRQAQRDFVANVGHDLKTPLTSIQGFTQALLDGTASTPQAQERAATIIHNESQRLGRLVEELLDVARLDTDQLPLRRESVDVGRFLSGMMARYAPQSQAAGVALTLAPMTEALRLHADTDRLQRVFDNLLDNALAHTPAGGAITVTARRMVGSEKDRPQVEISVADTGSGIPQADLAHIFDRFYRVDKSRSGRRGSGLGLAIVQELVHAHGGSVSVESVQGQGTVFRVRLPLARSET